MSVFVNLVVALTEVVFANGIVGADGGLVAGCDYLPVHKDVVAVGDVESGVHVVIGDENSDPLFGEAINDVLKFFDGDGVYSGERFVEEDEVGFGSHGAGDFDPSPLASREDSAEAREDPFDTEFFGETVNAFVLDFAGEAPGLEHEAEVIFDGEAAEDTGFLGEITDAGAGPFVHGPAGDGLAVKFDLASGGPNQAGDHVKRCSFSGTVGAEESDNFAGAKFDADFIDDPAFFVDFDEVGRFDDHGLPPSGLILTLAGLPRAPYRVGSIFSLTWI